MEKKENISSAEEGDHSPNEDQIPEMLQKLEQQSHWGGRRLFKYGGFWCPSMVLRPVLSVQKYFKATNSDVILTSVPKSGTTWLVALTFSIANRSKFPIDQNPLLTTHPHALVPFLEYSLYQHQENPNLDHLSSPRIFTTHLPFDALPDSVRQSECKIIYICRNPLDQFISLRNFLHANDVEKETFPLELDEAFDKFGRGIHPFGPFWDHILGYWKAHEKSPSKVLFLKYEDLKEDTTFHVKKISEFLGCPFSLEEEEQGLVQEIARLCSLENLKNLEVNKNGKIHGAWNNNSFFRKGQVGDWINYLSPSMAESFQKIVDSKFQGTGFNWENFYSTVVSK